MHPFVIAALVVCAAQPQAPADAPPASRAAGSLKPAGPSSPAATPSAADVRGGVEALLGTRDGAISPEQWRKLGPAASPMLEEIAEDSKALSTRRGRALEGLAALRSPHSPAIFTRLSQSAREPFLVRVAAMRGAGRTLSPARQLAALKPALERAADVRLRAVAAEVLSQHPANCAAVRAQSTREPAETQPRFEASLRRCGSK